MRLFVAVEFSQTVKDALCEAMNCLRRQGIEGRFTRRDNLHLTLAFIGESERTTDAVRAINRVAAESFSLKLKGSGFFGDLMWAGVEKNEALDRLANDVAQALREENFKIERRAFVPHITLVRKASENAKNIPIRLNEARMIVSGVSLMRSERIDGRLVYSRVYVRRF